MLFRIILNKVRIYIVYIIVLMYYTKYIIKYITCDFHFSKMFSFCKLKKKYKQKFKT